MKKRVIPSAAGRYSEQQQHDFNVAVKQRLELLSGEIVSPIELLKSDATLDEVVAKINEILTRIQ